MYQSRIIPPNVIRLMPPFVKRLLGYQKLSRRTSKNNGDGKGTGKPSRKFDLWKPDRMPVFMPIILIIGGFLFVSFVLHCIFKDHDYQIKDGGICKTKELLTKRNILFVFAHPDDEVMFFSPTVLALTSSSNFRVFFLCLSTGNSAGLGATRKQELLLSASVLGVKSEHVVIVDDQRLQDSQSIKWDSKVVSDKVMEIVKKFSVDGIITFDEGGVSGHVNHISAFEGVRDFMQRADVPKGIVAYKLITTWRIRKFSSILDVPLSYVGCDAMFVNSWSDRSRALDAMSKHNSQWVWFRKLYMLVSRYMLVNTLQQIPQTTHNKTS